MVGGATVVTGAGTVVAGVEADVAAGGGVVATGVEPEPECEGAGAWVVV